MPTGFDLPPTPRRPLDPAQVARWLPQLPPGLRPPVRAALQTLADAVAGWWAHRRAWPRAVVAAARVEGTCVHVYRIVDSARRLRHRGGVEADDLRLALMPDGIGRELARPWSARLAWMADLERALSGPYADVVEHVDLGWLVEHLRTEITTAARAAGPWPAVTEQTLFDAAVALEASVCEAVEHALAVGVEAHALLLPPPPVPARRTVDAPTTRVSGTSEPPVAEPPVAEGDDADQSGTDRAARKPIA